MLHRHDHARAGGDQVHRAAHPLDHLPLVRVRVRERVRVRVRVRVRLDHLPLRNPVRDEA